MHSFLNYTFFHIHATSWKRGNLGNGVMLECLGLLLAGETKLGKQQNQRMHTLIICAETYKRTQKSFLNHGNLVGKSESKKKIQYPDILSGWNSTIAIK